jgi:hypothetical protein
VSKTGWGSHEDMPMAISLDAIGNLDETRVTKNLGPTSQIESGLQSEIRKLDGDRHKGRIRQKLKYASTLAEVARVGSRELSCGRQKLPSRLQAFSIGSIGSLKFWDARA